jgi:hypothetical protein
MHEFAQVPFLAFFETTDEHGLTPIKATKEKLTFLIRVHLCLSVVTRY